MVATPIGNLGDITLRAIEVLKEVEVIFAEDTRQTRKLLSHLGIKKPIERFDAHVSKTHIEKLIEIVRGGRDAALVSDAGTPNLSDPGYKILGPALKQGIEVVPIPGPSALSAIVSISHFSLGEFLFLGFPPTKKGREKFFKYLAKEKRAIILYESPHRIKKTLTSLAELLPQREIIVAKELTKIHERVWRGSVRDVHEAFNKLIQAELRGEYVLALARNE